MSIDTGHLATITFATSGHVKSWKTMDPGTESRESVEDWDLQSTKKTKFAGDLVDEGQLKATFQQDDDDAVPTTTTVSEPITITYKSGATLSGTGIIVSVKRAPIQTNLVKMMELTVDWDGKTGPVFTPAP